MTIGTDAFELHVRKAWADFINCRADQYFGNRSKMDKQLDVLRRFARTASSTREGL